MIVRFYNIIKRENSTMRPTGSGAEYTVTLKADTSVLSPVLLIDFDDQDDPQPHLYNYAYIQDFNRYYFITDQRCIRGNLWEYSLTVDVLASYRQSIISNYYYLIRCSSVWDGSVIDTYYPVKTSNNIYVTSAATPWVRDMADGDVNLLNGCFVLGIISSPDNINTQFGSVKYVVMDSDNLESLIDYLMDANTLVNGAIAMNGISDEAAKSIIDPLSFIVSCQWVPFLYSEISTVERGSFKIWSWNPSGIRYKPIPSDPPYLKNDIVFSNIPKHPQAAARGVYLNTAPYTKLTANIPPFGGIELDTTLAAAVNQITCRTVYDLITGQGILEIYYGNPEYAALNTRVKSQIGVPIQLTQVYNDYISAAGGAVGGIMSAIGSVLSGNILGTLAGGLAAVGSAVDAMRPVVSSVGGNGGFSDLHGAASLYTICYDLPEEDLSHVGRPCCKNIQIQTLRTGSFCMALSGDIPIAQTQPEQAALKAYLEGGFYYE